MLLDAVTTYIHNLPDARQLSFAVLGLPLNSGRAAQTIVYSHGWPSSRLEALPLHDVAVNLGYRILSVDRPGVGKSTYNAAGACAMQWVHRAARKCHDIIMHTMMHTSSCLAGGRLYEGYGFVLGYVLENDMLAGMSNNACCQLPSHPRLSPPRLSAL
jgi:pimeloyl-ACP methyl ester carboxylesterase